MFEIMIDNNSMTGGISKIEESLEEGSVSNILASNEYVLNKHEFIIVSNGLSCSFTTPIATHPSTTHNNTKIR